MEEYPESDLGSTETLYHVQRGSSGTIIEIDKFSLWYGLQQALFQNTMSFEKGLVTALIGPSGCGKSTLLRSLNRMNDLIDGLRTDGKIHFDGTNIYNPDVDVIGLSIYSGAHLPLAKKLMAQLKANELTDKLVLIGGNIPHKDIPELKDYGISGVFPIGARLDEIVTFIKEKVGHK